MLEGIYLWDAKYGVPEDPNDSDSVETFINQLREKPQQANANLHGFAQFFGQFLQQAEEHYPDDRAVTQNQDIANLAQDEAIDTVLFLDEMPSDSFDYFASMLTHGANLYNLAYTDSMSYLIRQPTDPAQTEENLTKWQQYLAELKQEPNTEQKALPATKAKAKKLVASLLEERLNDLGVNDFKISTSDEVKVKLKFRGVSIDFLNILTLDLSDNDVERVWIEPYIYLWIEGIKEHFNVSYFHFYRVPHDHKIIQDKYLASHNVTELKANLEKGLEMLMHIYPHIQSLEKLYQFLLNSKDDKHLSRHYFSGLNNFNQRVIYKLACITNQPNLPELHDKLKREYIDDKLFALQEREKAHHIREEEDAKKFEGYTKYPFRKPENPEQKYAQMFDDYVAQIGQGE